MSNMNYCRFENTYPDLRDCLEDLNVNDGLDHLSESEKKYATNLIRMCGEIWGDYGYLTKKENI